MHIRDNAFKGMCAPDDTALAVQVFKFNFLTAAAVQDNLPDAFIQFGIRAIDSKSIVLCQRFYQLEVVGIAPVPAAYGAVRQTQ